MSNRLVALALLPLLVACPSAPADPPAEPETPSIEEDHAGTEAADEPVPSPADREADEDNDPRIAEPSSVSDSAAMDDPALPCAGMVNRALIARRIEAREPVDTHGPFEADGEPVHVFMELNNPDVEATMTVRWFHDGSRHQFGQTITAGVSPSWRTWVRHRIQPEQTGRWRVQVLAPGECLAAELSFDTI